MNGKDMDSPYQHFRQCAFHLKIRKPLNSQGDIGILIMLSVILHDNFGPIFSRSGILTSMPKILISEIKYLVLANHHSGSG